MKMYHTATQKAYDELMLDLEEKGYKWLSGHKPTHFKYWKHDKENTCIKISGKDITLNSIEWYKKEYPDTPVIEYKEKGDNQMANKECNQCHKKWHQDSAKYCSWCGNKLVSESEFKVGDYVALHAFNKEITKIEKIYGDKLHGLWYDTESESIRLDYYLGGGTTVKHATPTEIKEYKVALTFHKHGRKPFEIKEGDILLDSETNIFFVNEDIEIWNKEDFISGDFTFLKTAEEVNEWIKGENE